MSYFKATLNVEQIKLYGRSSVVNGFGIQGTLVMPGDIFGCHNNRWTESRDAVKYHVIHRRDSHKKRIIHPKMSVVLRLKNPDLYENK